VSEDREGDELEAEIARDRREESDRKRRRILFVPPLIALAVAAWALGVSRPRQVLGARVIAGGRPTAAPLHVRVQVVRAIPGIESTETVPGVELRPFANAVVGRAETTDEQGIAEVVIDAPVPPFVKIEAKVGAGYREVGSLALAALKEADPRDGVVEARRTSGSQRGDLRVDVAPELGALAPPLPGAIFVRVRTSGGSPAAGARVSFVADGGLAADPVAVVVDHAGLARVELQTIATPVALTATAEREGKTGVFSGMIGSVLAAPRPRGDGVIAKGSKTIELLSPSSRASAYWDLWQSGVRLGGGRLTFDHGAATLTLPNELSGVIDLETSGSALPPSAADLSHAATWPLVVASDDVDAWGAVKTSPRFLDPLTPGGALADYRPAVAATLAFAPPALPRRSIVTDGLEPELRREVRRGRQVRQFASLAVVGGGFFEVGLMLWLGVFGRGPTVAEAMTATASVSERSEELEDDQASNGSRRWLGVALTGLGIIALMFAALATMAWGLP